MRNKLVVLVFILVLVFQFVDLKIFDDRFLNESAESIIVGYAASILILFLIRKDEALYRTERLNGKIITLLPCFLIVINNFPFLSLIKGDAQFVKPWHYGIILLVDCFGVAMFEEFVFRGILLPAVHGSLKRGPFRSFLAVLIQAAIFGGMHFFNLLAGASFPIVLMQVGYTFLLGGMFAIALLISGNIWVSVSLHFLFNFTGLLLPTMGEGDWPDQATIVITIILSVLAAAYLMALLLKLSKTMHEEETTDLL